MGFKTQKYLNSLLKLFRRTRRIIAGGQRILVLGDSHSGVFEYIYDRDLLRPHVINCETLSGVTACGLANDSSTTRSFKKFTEAVRRYASYNVIVIMLGEVDCGFALWHKAKKASLPVETQICYSVNGISRLLLWIKTHFPKKQIIIAGAILPTVKDADVTRQGLPLRESIKATQLQRTNLVLALNDELKKLAASFDVHYIDITVPTRDLQSGMVQDRFLMPSVDIHQSQEFTAAFWVDALRSLLQPARDGDKAVRR